MKLLSLLLAFFVSSNVMAVSLERAMDDYHYALSVEWDQQDKIFYQQQTEKFFNEISSLGVTEDEVMALVEKKAAGKLDLAALKLKVQLLTGNIQNSDQFAQVLTANMSSIYMQGASWNGETALIIGIGVILAGAIAYTIWWNVKYQCEEYRVERVCGWVDDSYGVSDWRCWNERNCVRWSER